MGVVQDFFVYLGVARNKNATKRVLDGYNAQIPVRGSGYGEMMVQNMTNSHHGLGDEGSYFVTGTPTPGTGALVPMVAAFADTTPALIIQNPDAGNNAALRAYMDYIKLILTVAGAGAPTDLQYAVYIDNNLRVSGNPASTLVMTPNNVNMDAQNTTVKSVLNVYFGALTAVAKSANARLIAQGNLRSIAPVVKDQFILTFGTVEKAVMGQNLALATAGVLGSNCGPGIIGGLQSLLLYVWSTGETTTGKTFSLEMGHWER